MVKSKMVITMPVTEAIRLAAWSLADKIGKRPLIWKWDRVSIEVETMTPMEASASLPAREGEQNV